MSNRKLSGEQSETIINLLKERFGKNMARHKGIEWSDVQKRLEGKAEKLWSLSEMERTGGEPDVVGRDEKTGEFIFYDCSPESPSGRRSLCYDHEALEARKNHPPKNSAMNVAKDMGIDLLDEEQYRSLQALGNYDLKTSSWLMTPAAIRKKGGAIFGDKRYDHVFIYHNGADSYYAARGFRGWLKV